MTRNSKQPTRLYVDAALESGSIALDADQSHYLGRVLRCRSGDSIVVFNGRGQERLARVDSLAKRGASITLGDAVEPLPEPGRSIVLLQALVKSDAMDLIVQKATELGVSTLLITRTQFSVVRLDGERKQRRLDHWRRIALSACEQSGRHRPPDIEVFDDIDIACAALPSDSDRIVFDLGVETPFEPVPAGSTCIAIGPEGGFSSDDRAILSANGFRPVAFGPRILRSETAAIAACTAVQLLEGDLR